MLWVSGGKLVVKRVTVAVARMHIFKPLANGQLATLSRESATMKQIAEQVVRTAPEDNGFLWVPQGLQCQGAESSVGLQLLFGSWYFGGMSGISTLANTGQQQFPHWLPNFHTHRVWKLRSR
jgi:hypothetical protein